MKTVSSSPCQLSPSHPVSLSTFQSPLQAPDSFHPLVFYTLLPLCREEINQTFYLQHEAKMSLQKCLWMTSSSDTGPLNPEFLQGAECVRAQPGTVAQTQRKTALFHLSFARPFSLLFPSIFIILWLAGKYTDRGTNPKRRRKDSKAYVGTVWKIKCVSTDICCCQSKK